MQGDDIYMAVALAAFVAGATAVAGLVLFVYTIARCVGMRDARIRAAVHSTMRRDSSAGSEDTDPLAPPPTFPAQL